MQSLLIVVGWLLAFATTAVVGGWIADSYQKKGWLFQQRIIGRKQKFDRNLAIVQRLIGLVDARLNASRDYVTAIRTLDCDRIHAERERYRSVVAEWGSKAPALTNAMITYIDEQKGRNFDRYFFPEFRSIDDRLGQARRKIDKGELDVGHLINESVGIIYRMNYNSRDFSYEIHQMMAEEERAIDQTPRISLENIADLSYSYLLKSLFQPRSQP